MSAVAGSLEQLARQLPGGLPHLLAARRHTDDGLSALRERVAQVALPAACAVVILGSWARGEANDHSDNDWLVLCDTDRDVGGALEQLNSILSADEKAPGRQGIFGVAARCDDLVGHIGLQHDDNRNLTQRMLLMLESRPLSNDDIYDRSWARILDGYLDASIKPRQPPRFFLNDLIRYWRTIAVDFVGKERQEPEGWAMRNAKLRLSRKLLFASGLVPLLLCHRFDRDGIRAFLDEQLHATAVDRIAYAFLSTGAHDAGLRALGAYDRWLGLLQDAAVRRSLKQLPREQADSSELFREIRTLSDQLEQGLLALLFESDRRLAGVVREYTIF